MAIRRNSSAVSSPTIEALDVSAYTIPTDFPESDGTYTWDQTTIVIVHATAAGVTGLGYSYADIATARLIDEQLKPRVLGHDAMSVPGCWHEMVHAIRNLGRPGICSMAISAVDNALWDLKARLLGVPLLSLFGAAREAIAVYGSGGFTSYSDAQLAKQLGGWAAEGIGKVKMKIGREPARDLDRVRVAREAIGARTELFVDANGAYARKQALTMAQEFSAYNVTWFEEPVSSDDLEGLRLMRDRGPAGMAIAAGEYGYDAWYFRRMLEAGAVDVLQADATRCGGFTGFLLAAALCDARSMPLSAHCAPNLHAHVCCSAIPAVHIEYFHDHARIERMLFDGALEPHGGVLRPGTEAPGMGLVLKESDASKYAVYKGNEAESSKIESLSR